MTCKFTFQMGKMLKLDDCTRLGELQAICMGKERIAANQ